MTQINTKRFLAFSLLLSLVAPFAWATQPVQLLCKRHKTEWNWTEYRITLKNISDTPILYPEIRYFAENSITQYCEKNANATDCRTYDSSNPPKDTLLRVSIDNVTSPHTIVPEISTAGRTTIVKFKMQGMLYPNASAKINFRLYKKKWDKWSPKNDWSYQRTTGTTEPNYFMAVYDGSRNILWGQDPVTGKTNADIVLWSERGSNFSVERFAGDTSEYIPAGRFWMLKDSPLSPKERDLLTARGVVKHSVNTHQGKTLAMFRSENRIKKSMLDSIVAGFYNAFPVNDTTALKINLQAEDLYEKKENCDANGACHSVIVTRSDVETVIFCWPDVSVNSCVETIANCGGNDIGVTRGAVAARMRPDSLQCLAQSHNIDNLEIQSEPEPSGAKDLEAINISALQDSPEWEAALASTRVTEDWLSDAKYTGKGIIVGVYDEGFDTKHPDFYEDDPAGQKVLRTIRNEEYSGVAYDPDVNLETLSDNHLWNTQISWHGTNTLGIIGGNGSNSPAFEYRGVAPKVHFFLGDMTPFYQIGHVANHSHITSNRGIYLSSDRLIDQAIFNNWKSGCTQTNSSLKPIISNCIEGDILAKTVVFSAHNNGDDFGDPNSKKQITRGYHSIMANTKNAIIVGNITSKEKIRFHHSSMGPTWDGRIKPDIMAPGATSQIAASQNNPVEISVDYVKLYRLGSTEPYLVIDAKDNPLEFDPENTGFTYPPAIEDHGEGNFAYNFKTETNIFFGITAGWILDKDYTVSPSDRIEIRFKKGRGWNDDNTILGRVFLGTQTSLVEIPAIWDARDQYTTTSLPLSSMSSNVDVHSLRIDFSFIKSIVAPTRCNDDYCGYSFLTDGGTSAAAPFVSGIAALMYQKFRDTTGKPLDKRSMRNSTVKALMIHTAIDMEDTEQEHFADNPDILAAHHDGNHHYTPYGKGPDFATGWGRVDGGAALGMLSGYDSKTGEFAKFREIEIGEGIEKRWTTTVLPNRNHLRATLVWDDAPGKLTTSSNRAAILEPQLVNDLDMYLISPSGKYHYPWRLDPLPNEYISKDGLASDAMTSFERIMESDVHDAYNGCGTGSKLEYGCFDHLNNVEVVDVDNPEPGQWQIVVMGRTINAFNNADNNAQVATLVSDEALSAKELCSVVHDYAPQTDYRCTYPLGKDAISYVTFDERTFTGTGDNIQLFDEKGNLLGTYVENQLAGKTIKLKSRQLTIELHSDNDKSQGWGFAVTKIKVFPKSVLKMPFEFTTKNRRKH